MTHYLAFLIASLPLVPAIFPRCAFNRTTTVRVCTCVPVRSPRVTQEEQHYDDALSCTLQFPVNPPTSKGQEIPLRSTAGAYMGLCGGNVLLGFPSGAVRRCFYDQVRPRWFSAPALVGLLIVFTYRYIPCIMIGLRDAHPAFR